MEVIKTLSVDIETFSSTNLSKSGVYKYASSPDFEVLLFAYSINHGAVKVVDLASGEKIPTEIIEAIKSDEVIKWAFNANFERICLSHHLGMKVGEYLSPASWRCSMVWSAYMGLPLSLEGVGAVLGLDKQKLGAGKDLIRYFCIPCTPTKTNGNRKRNHYYHDKEKWELFKKYNRRDVEVEVRLQEKLKNHPVPDFLWEEYKLDQIINDRGIKIDRDFVTSAIKVNDISRKECMNELSRLTNLENPNSVMQMRSWLKEHGIETESLDKKVVNELLDKVDEKARKVLLLRQKISRSSIKKYEAMINASCTDDRCRGMFQFLGANRTGRWSGRLVQLQNLKRNSMTDLKEARELVKMQNLEALDLLYEDIPNTLSELIRTAFIPKKDTLFFVADFSAIEARVIAYLAGEEWRNQSFREGKDIYCMSASQMFNVPVEKHGVNGELRQKGKVAELACGYGGSVGALKAMGALDMGLTEEDLKPLVDSWRKANPNIVNLWWNVDREIKRAIKTKKETETNGIKFLYKGKALFIELPSKRTLTYIKPEIEINAYGSESITYQGIGANKKWEKIESYGPKFVENIVQAISRDLLMEGIRNLADLDIVAHVHDEIILEAKDNISLDEICKKMSKVPDWCKDLYLNADGYICEFYKKD
ncbi:DNA polymerase [Ligilactobacillus ceti]|uniref:DNA-directed DNA polymerase n=1 Tax=Ligilactobacillus ceti DSM 22408 TaxID=1122146 RepID=A0A0R2KH72_9LACO|nr:DNA polymerase [Ligilactobacillus ceti]KRN88738.1 prophage LambdaSa04 DNA-directed DNA polymerase [Ligilactobacillus ceti DSM 22408]